MAYVSTYKEFLKLKEDYELNNNLCFVAVKGLGVNRKDEDLNICNIKKWHLVDGKRKFVPEIKASSPFYVVGRRIFDCHQGPDRHRKSKEKKQEKQPTDHAYKGTRRLVQNTKKVGCTAQVKVQEVLVLKSVQIGNPSRRNRTKVRAVMKEILHDPNFNMSLLERRFYYSFADLKDHSGHLLGETAGHLLPIDPMVRTKVEELVSSGVRQLGEIRRHLELYVKKDLFGGNLPPSSNRRFHPTNKDLANIVQSTLDKKRHSLSDQCNLAKFVEESKTAPDNHFFLRKKSPETSDEQEEFLFVHQNEWQQLLGKYGQEICLLDATYNTSKYDMPCFFVCVNTNFGYVNVAMMLLERETKDSITEALEVLKKWNPNWHPKHFITDFDEREIDAVETVFPGNNIEKKE